VPRDRFLHEGGVAVSAGGVTVFIGMINLSNRLAIGFRCQHPASIG
jgi:hypothetical protein